MDGCPNTLDMDWCKAHLPAILGEGAPMEFCEGHSCIEDHAIMTYCDHAIIANISTFAWWAGYLNPNPKARIVVPSSVPGYSQINTYWARRFQQITA